MENKNMDIRKACGENNISKVKGEDKFVKVIKIVKFDDDQIIDSSHEVCGIIYSSDVFDVEKLCPQECLQSRQNMLRCLDEHIDKELQEAIFIFTDEKREELGRKYCRRVLMGTKIKLGTSAAFSDPC